MEDARGAALAEAGARPAEPGSKGRASVLMAVEWACGRRRAA